MQKLFSARRLQILSQRSNPVLSAKTPPARREDTEHIRTNFKWKASPTPTPLQRRWVELTGPGNDPKMIIHAMNSQANGYMLDLEDSMAPTRDNVVRAHENIRQLIRNKLSVSTATKNYEVVKDPKPTLMIRVRGLHMPNEGMIYDLCEFLEHNAHRLYEEGRGPYLYVPKLETYEEALFVNDMLTEAESYLHLQEGCIKVTALIETFPAIFQTEEIIYALRNRLVGLNCGRWDYLFSMMKSLPYFKYPDRGTLDMKQPYMEAYVKQIVQSCHKRDIHAMGGMSAFIPSGKGDSETNERIQKTVFADKTIEILHGCDGAWVAHPALIEPVQSLFKTSLKGKDHQKHFSSLSLDEQQSSNLFIPGAKKNEPFTRKCFERNVDVAIKYLTRWLSGNGAVALYGLMEDLATAEISSVQLRNWLDHKIISLDDFNKQLNISMSGKGVSDPRVHHILETYVTGNAKFLIDVAGPAFNLEGGFDPIKFPKDNIIDKPKTGVELTKYRGNFLNNYLRNNNSYGFLGTSNGVSAVNVVAGGSGRVGPYAGGWQSNAMKNRLNMCLPDTLHVSVEDCAQCAHEVNEHLYRAHLVQSEQGLNNINYEDIAFLADLEQGWNTPEKTRIAVRRCVEAGVNVIHIEDQGDKKRCGHLGDKELNSYNDYALIMRSANLAAHEMGVQDYVTFVARTDAYSAKRIHYSEQLRDPNNPEHKFVDWSRGHTPDGKYLYLKEGLNDATGRRWGLDLAIYRGTKIVDDGLASHVWMETPDADLQVAKDFLNGVNENLNRNGKHARGLYNHSPSFDWDIKFVAEAKPLAEAVAVDIRSLILSKNDWSLLEIDDTLVFKVRESISKNGRSVQGDNRYSDETIRKMIPHLFDYSMGEHKFYKQFEVHDVARRAGSFDNAITELRSNSVYRPLDAITDIIVDERLRLFGPMLASFGYDLHLITLPEFHVTAFRMHDLARRFKDSGIEAFVTTTQRPERVRMTTDPSYTYYKHQTATGTGVEAAFNLAVGSSNVNALSSSTETDDLRKRQ